MTKQPNHDDLLWQHLKTVPAFRALLRAVEARFYQHVDLPGPVLDVGCGDGHFAQLTFDRHIDAGLDLWWGPLQKAKGTGCYRTLVQGMGNQMPFPDSYFASAFSNSVLEHIPDVQAVLKETNRVLQRNGRFLITTPSHYFTQYLGGAAFLEQVGLDGLADNYRNLFNTISRHVHTEPPQWWAERLAQAGFQVERWQYYFSREALRALEWGHVQGLPSAVIHALTGHWILGPYERNLRWTEQWVRPFYEEPFNPHEGAYLLFVTRKVKDAAIPTRLPAARPFPVEEIGEQVETGDQRLEIEPGQRPSVEETPLADDEPEQITTVPSADADESEQAPEAETPNLQSPTSSTQSPVSSLHSPLISAMLLALTLIAALIGQSILSNNPVEPGSGLRWYAISLLALGALAYRHRRTISAGRSLGWRLPRLSDIPRRRWFYTLALLLALMAYRQASNPLSVQRPGLAIGLWLAAIGVAFYALYRPDSSSEREEAPDTDEPPYSTQPFTLIASLLLFLAALLLRIILLTDHPFILNGTEANIGLDALRVVEGGLRNPFGAGWLTNPTLPYFLMSIPLRLLGPSTLSVRLLSPLMGAATVTAVFWLGQRLYGRTVGLVAAVLLLGSHYHLHYSRIGTTNVWDPLLVWLALGGLALAWEQRDNRRLWLLAGTAVGLNAYVYTASHLLPLMLLAVGGLLMLTRRERLWQRRRGLLAAFLMALVVAAPQSLFYRAHPDLFMERANALGIGILAGPQEWLSREAAARGVTQGQVLSDQVRRAALAFNATLDKSTYYNAQTPLLSFGTAVFFVLGLAIALARLRRFRYAMLVVWVAITVIFAGVLLENPPQSHRLVIATPALVLLAAIGLERIGRFAATIIAGYTSTSPDLAKTPAATHSITYVALAPIAIAILFILSDLAFYFGRYRNQPTFGDLNTEVADAMGYYLDDLDGDWTAYFHGPPRMYAGFPTIPFLAEGFETGVNLFDVTEADSALPPAPTTGRVHIFLPERMGELEALRQEQPNGRLQQIPGYYNSPLFYAYELPAP